MIAEEKSNSIYHSYKYMVGDVMYVSMYVDEMGYLQ